MRIGTAVLMDPADTECGLCHKSLENTQKPGIYRTGGEIKIMCTDCSQCYDYMYARGKDAGEFYERTWIDAAKEAKKSEGEQK